MKWSIDGDQICVTKDDFINLQESPAVLIPRDSEAGRAIESGGIRNMTIGDLYAVRSLFQDGGGEYREPRQEEPDPAYAEYNHIREQAGLPPLGKGNND